jgi:hypothetical protein
MKFEKREKDEESMMIEEEAQNGKRINPSLFISSFSSLQIHSLSPTLVLLDSTVYASEVLFSFFCIRRKEEEFCRRRVDRKSRQTRRSSIGDSMGI